MKDRRPASSRGTASERSPSARVADWPPGDVSQTLLGDAQQELARRVRDRLHRVGAQFVERLAAHPAEVTIAFRLAVREPQRLTADISVGCDGFWFTADGAALSS